MTWTNLEENRTKILIAMVVLVGGSAVFTFMHGIRPRIKMPAHGSENSSLDGSLPPVRPDRMSPLNKNRSLVSTTASPSPSQALAQTAAPARPVVPSALQASSIPVAAAPPAKTEDPLYGSYKYEGDRYRDPFIPLTGVPIAADALNRPPAISTLVLKGIIQDTKGERIALLTSGAQSYLLRGGRLYDGRNKVVPGIAGVVKISSVVLITSGATHQSVEAKLKTAEF